MRCILMYGAFVVVTCGFHDELVLEIENLPERGENAGFNISGRNGKRLKELTRNSAKCVVKVNGKTLIERMLFILTD